MGNISVTSGIIERKNEIKEAEPKRTNKVSSVGDNYKEAKELAA